MPSLIHLILCSFKPVVRKHYNKGKFGTVQYYSWQSHISLVPIFIIHPIVGSLKHILITYVQSVSNRKEKFKENLIKVGPLVIETSREYCNALRLERAPLPLLGLKSQGKGLLPVTLRGYMWP